MLSVFPAIATIACEMRPHPDMEGNSEHTE